MYSTLQTLDTDFEIKVDKNYDCFGQRMFLCFLSVI